ncbi:MAG TPA: hypothetical protein VF914_01930, partial [Chloroflexia bacterium]
LNLDAPIRSLLQPEGVGRIDPQSLVADAIVAWEGYGLIIKGRAQTIEEISSLIDTVQSLTGLAGGSWAGQSGTSRPGQLGGEGMKGKQTTNT